MPNALDLDQRSYFQLLHAILREDSSDAEIERTDDVMRWICNVIDTLLDRVCDATEMELIRVVHLQWSTHKKCPTRETLAMVIRNGMKPKALLDLLGDYDKHVDDLKKITHADMDPYLHVRVDEFEKNRLMLILDNARHIVSGGISNPDNRKGQPELPPLTGTRDSMNYLMKKFQSGIMINDVRPDGGLLSGYGNHMRETIARAKEDRRTGRLIIPTGIPVIEEHMGGLRRKEFTGVLGYKGQRKTAVVRTMAYNAAKAGFRVLHIPIETDFAEEKEMYDVIHAHAFAAREGRKSSLTRMKIIDGETTPAEDEEVFAASDNFTTTVGLNLALRKPAERTWSAVKSLIELEISSHPVDLVIVDYLTMLNDESARDAVAKMTMIVQEAKQLALTANDGKGLAFVTPVQGNRKGYEDAQANDGVWDTTGIWMYSELDKSLDNCWYVFTNSEISASSQLKMGSCKHRRGADIPATMVPINVSAGVLVDTTVKAASERVTLPPPPPVSAEVFFDYAEWK